MQFPIIKTQLPAIAALVVALIFPSAAHASFWLECRVKADIEQTQEAGYYRVMIHSAIVSGGHSEKGAPCLQDKAGQAVTVAIGGGKVPVGANRELIYNYYNDRTAEGVVNRESWSVPSFFQRLF